MSPGHHLPPVKQKKKSSKRCFMCAKKTGLATSYPCRYQQLDHHIFMLSDCTHIVTVMVASIAFHLSNNVQQMKKSFVYNYLHTESCKVGNE